VTTAATTAGALRGRRVGELDVFIGVPYAAPPVGDRRWRPPEPVEPWTGARDATVFGPIAPQAITAERLAKRGLAMGEDCLHLNVWTPAADDARRPVVVFLHGGGVVLGSPSVALLDGARLAERGDVVVVTVGFRLGALGSLLAPGAVAANVALRDQLQALRWVRAEIGAFGGDPSDVTVVGQSSGAVAIACMLAGTAATGLFDRAILQSGGLERVRSPEAAASVARRFHAALGREPGSDAGVEAILDAQATIPTGFVPPEGPWHHCVDGDLVQEHPLAAAARRPLLPVPILAGTTSDEWRAFDAVLTDAEVSEDHLRTRARALLGDGAVLDDVLDRYAAERTEAHEVARRRNLGSALVTDFHFGAPTEQLLRAHAAHGNPAFRYELRWPSPKPGLGACHDTCLPLVFGTMDATPGLVGTGPEVEVMSAAVQDAWLAFIRGRAPWTPYDEDTRTTMILGAESGTVEHHRREQLDVWEGRYPAAG
jgi:para-nitrobenzyl esterase